MTCIRSLAVLLTLLSLLACDQSPVPQPAPQPKPPKTVSAKPLPVAPEVEPAPVKPAAVAKPAEPPVPAQPVAKAAASAPEAKPKPIPKPPATASKSVAPAPQAPLDLSLPAEVFEQLQPLEPLDDLSVTRLPPLFVEKTKPTSPFQLNGKLITNERSDDYWDSLEGAELQFEFKQ